MKHIISIGVLCLVLTGCTKDVVQAVVQVTASGTHLPIEDLYFLNDSVGYAVGGKAYEQGIILSTNNGGNTWKTDTLVNHALWSVVENEKHVIMATGFSGNLFIKNPGENWFHYRLPVYYEMTGILGDRNGGVFLSSGSSFLAGKIIHLNEDYSVDTVFVTGNEVREIAYSGPSSLVAVGYGAVFYSDDNGKTWQRSSVDGDYFRSVTFPEPGVGFIIGFSGTLYKTEDGGKSWKKLLKSGHLLYGQDTFLSMAFRNPKEGYISGQHGLLMKTTDGGHSWKYIERFTEDHLNTVSFTGNAVWAGSSSGKIYKITE